MQRVATELRAALADVDGLALDDVILRSTWGAIYPRMAPFLARVAHRLCAAARRQDTDVVLFSSMVTAALAVPLQRRLRRAGIRTAAIVHGLDVTMPVGLYQRFVPHVFDALDLVLPVSRATGQACLERGLSPEKLCVVPNGVNVTRFPAAPDPAARRSFLEGVPGSVPLAPEALLLCSVGRQVPRKGFAWFVEEVMPRLPAHVHYWLAGEGPEASAIAEAVRRHRLEDRVRLLGRLSEHALLNLYQGADLFVMPNVRVEGDMEGFGVVMLEAGLCGLPSVGARLEGILDVLREGANGHLVPSGDAEAFREVITAYDADRSALAAASLEAARYVRDTFGWPAVAAQYARALRSEPAPLPVPILSAAAG